MTEIQYLDYDGLQRYHELIDAKKADKTEIPTVNNATLTIQKNGTTVKTFTANASSNVTADIVVPTKVSDLTNDSNFTSNTGTVTGIKVGSSGTTLNPSSGIVTIPEYPTTLPANGGTAANVSGTVAIANGGTGATTAADARTNLGLGTLATKNSLSKSDVGLGNVTNESKATMFTNAALTGTPTAPTATAGTNTTQIATTEFVQSAISGITDAMVFSGTIGKASNGSGTISTLPTTGVKVGHTYKIVDENKSIVAANSATGSAVTAKVGDTIVATDATPKWVVIPSGDEPSGTVTSVVIKGSSPITVDSESAITSSGTRTISHATSGVTANSYGPTADVTGSNNTTIKVPQITVDSYGHVTAVTERTYTSVNNTYTVGNKALKVASNTGTATQAINVNENSADRTLTISGDGTYITGAVSGSANAPTVTLSHANPGTGSALTTSNGDAGTYAANTDYTVVTGVTVSADAKGHITGVSTTRLTIKDTTYESKEAASSGTAVSLVTTGEKYTWNNKQATLAKKGSTTKPIYTSAAGTIAECSTYAGGTAVTLNGTSKAASTASIYAPTAAGTSGLILIANSSGVPTWSDNLPVISHSAVGSATLDSTKQIDALFIS